MMFNQSNVSNSSVPCCSGASRTGALRGWMPPQLILALLLVLAVPMEGRAATALRSAQAEPAQTQLPMPDGVPWGTTIRLDGDPSNAPTNRVLQEGFRQRFPGATVQLARRGSDRAIQGLLDGDLDVAALGRRLTSQERAKGLVAVPLARHKIAIIIGPDNPFSGSLTDTQFAQIFRGEITDWEAVGGDPGPIRLIDRPATSDTRRAFSNYPVFQSAPFQAGETSIQVSDRTNEVIKALGSDGIGYAIVDQVSDREDLTIVPLHNVLPDDPRYAFSQPLAYVYKGPVPNPAAQAFLGYAGVVSQSGELVASKTAASALGTARSQRRTLRSATESEGATALQGADLGLDAPVAQVGQTTTVASEGRTPWWWLLLPLAVIPFLFRWMKHGTGPLAWGAAGSDEMAADSVEGAVYGSDVDLIGRGRSGAGPAGVVPAVNPDGLQTPHQQKMPLDRQPTVPPMFGAARLTAAGAAAAGAAAAGAAGAASTNTPPPLTPLELAASQELADRMSTEAPQPPQMQEQRTQLPGAIPAAGGDQTWITLTPLSSDQAQVNWHLSQEHLRRSKEQGGEQLVVKVHDADHIDLDVQPPHSTQSYACAEGTETQMVELPASDRDYVAEVGYLTADQQWLRVARSVHSHSPTPDYDGCRIVIMPCDQNRRMKRELELTPQAYVYWDISEEYKQMLWQRSQLQRLGQMLVLRVYDADQIDLDQQSAHHMDEYVIDELARDKVVAVAVGDRDYVAEIGYRTLGGDFLSLGRSIHARIPRVKSSAS